MSSSPTKRIRFVSHLAAVMSCLAVACDGRQVAPREARAAAPTAPLDARPATDGTPADARPGMMERHAIWKAKKEADAKLAAELAAEERARLFKFDRAKLPRHAALLAFAKKARGQLDAAATKLKGKPGAADQLQTLVLTQRKAITAQGKALDAIDPKGGRSNITTDHDASLQLLADDYPAAIGAFLGGDEKPLAEVRAELDRRHAKIEAWLAELRKAKK